MGACLQFTEPLVPRVTFRVMLLGLTFRVRVIGKLVVGRLQGLGLGLGLQLG